MRADKIRQIRVALAAMTEDQLENEEFTLRNEAAGWMAEDEIEERLFWLDGEKGRRHVERMGR
jgi:hypothetical protein